MFNQHNKTEPRKALNFYKRRSNLLFVLNTTIPSISSNFVFPKCMKVRQIFVRHENENICTDNFSDQLR